VAQDRAVVPAAITSLPFLSRQELMLLPNKVKDAVERSPN
jgi:hypothetical protein